MLEESTTIVSAIASSNIDIALKEFANHKNKPIEIMTDVKAFFIEYC
jgi:hypothetical protein